MKIKLSVYGLFTCFLVCVLISPACNSGQQSEINNSSGEEGSINSKNPNTEEVTSIDSSDCTNWIVTETDKYSKETSSYGKVLKLPVGNSTTDYLEIVTYVQDLLDNEKTIGLMCALKTPKNCIDKNLKVDFLFDDATSFTLLARSEFNCKGEFIILFDDNFSNYPAKQRLSDFTTKNLSSCRLNGYDQITEISLDAGMANQFRHTISCVQNMMVNK